MRRDFFTEDKIFLSGDIYWCLDFRIGLKKIYYFLFIPDRRKALFFSFLLLNLFHHVTFAAAVFPRVVLIFAVVLGNVIFIDFISDYDKQAIERLYYDC